MIITKLNNNVGEAIRRANELLDKNSTFFKGYTQPELGTFTPDMATVSFLQAVVLIKAFADANDVEVVLWRPWKLRWSSALAMTKGKRIYLNRYKLNRSVDSIVGSIVHELTHIVELKYRTKQATFWHGNNYRHGKDFPAGKRRTMPYLMGELAKLYVTKGHIYRLVDLVTWPRSWDK